MKQDGFKIVSEAIVTEFPVENGTVWIGAAGDIKARCKAIANYRKKKGDAKGFAYWSKQAKWLEQFPSEKRIKIIVPK